MKRIAMLLVAAGTMMGQGRQSNGCPTSGAIVPEGTAIIVRIETRMSSKTHDAGDRFTGILDSAIRVKGIAIVETGVTVIGRVVTRKRSLQGDELTLELVSLESVCGNTVAVSTDPLIRRNERSFSSGAIRTASTAALGAAIGGIAGGGRGAAIGAAAGGAVGTGGAAIPGKPVEVKSETILVFRLRRELRVER